MSVSSLLSSLQRIAAGGLLNRAALPLRTSSTGTAIQNIFMTNANRTGLERMKG